MSLEKALASVQGSVPECVAVGYVDMGTGMLLGIRTVDSHPSEVLDLVAAATADMFQGPNVTAIEELFNKSRGYGLEQVHYFQEMLVTSKNLLHVFMRGKRHNNHALVIVCRASANIGMVLTKARLALQGVEASL